MNNVLIIEDDKEICVMIKDHLEKYNYQVFFTLTGANAIERIKELSPDLIIIEASNPVPTPLLGHRCRSSQEITGSPTPFSTSNHYLWICASASFSLSNPNIAA